MGQLLKKFALKIYYFYAYRLFWMVIMLRIHIDMVHKSVSDYIEDYSTIIVPAILLITLWMICIFEISLPLIIFMVIFLFFIYLLSLTESKCINGHTWIKVGEHNVSEPWSDKQFITYSVADFKCSVCGMKKEETVESIEKRNRINEEKKWSNW